jgi:hypothetical protein
MHHETHKRDNQQQVYQSSSYVENDKRPDPCKKEEDRKPQENETHLESSADALIITR